MILCPPGPLFIRRNVDWFRKGAVQPPVVPRVFVLLALLCVSSSGGADYVQCRAAHLLDPLNLPLESLLRDQTGVSHIDVRDVFGQTIVQYDSMQQNALMRRGFLQVSSNTGSEKAAFFYNGSLGTAKYLSFVMAAFGSHKAKVTLFSQDPGRKPVEERFALFPDGELHRYLIDLKHASDSLEKPGGFSVTVQGRGVTLVLTSVVLLADLPAWHTRLDRRNDRRPSVMIPAGGRLLLDLPENAANVSFGLSISNLTRQFPSEPCEFEVLVRLGDGDSADTVLSLEIGSTMQRTWRDHKLELPAHDSAERIEFAVKARERTAGSASRFYVAVSEPVAALQEEHSRPNLILYVVDTLRRDHVSCYGYKRKTTPRIDEFSQSGVIFESAHAQASWTKPSIATMLTSLYPGDHGAAGAEDRLPSEVTVLPELLRDAGYYTGAIVAAGAVGLPGLNFEQGFDEFVAMTDDHHDSLTSAAEVMTRLVPWINRNHDKNFFLYVHLMDPHSPYFPVPPYDTMFDPEYQGRMTGARRGPGGYQSCKDERDIAHVVALYDGEIAYTDEHFGRFIRELKEAKLFQNTVIVFTSDHGEELGERGSWGHGHTLYEELIKIPLIVKFSQGRHSGERVVTEVRHLDLAPTMIELAGLTVPEWMQGESLLSILEGDAVRTCTEVYSEETLNRNVLYSIISERRKYILRTSPTRSKELFDLEQDPRETSNLVKQDHSEVKALERRLLSHLASSERISHVRFSSSGRSAWKGRILSEGVFACVYPVGYGDCCSFSLDSTGAILSFELHTHQGSEGFDFVTVPPDVQLTFEVFVDGEKLDPGRLFLGIERRKATANPYSTKLLRDRTTLYAGDEEKAKLEPSSEPTCIFWRTLPGTMPISTKATFNKRTREKLKALGYIE